MRGKVGHAGENHVEFGITPAYAGKSLMIDLSVSWVRGSPPPMRGKAQCPYKPHGACGITPAYAGKSVETN